MATIKSRANLIDLTLLELQELVTEISLGAISQGKLFEPGTTVEECFDQIRDCAKGYQLALLTMRQDVARLIIDKNELTAELIELTNRMDKLMDVDYDEALDHASMDLMDAFCSSGSADVTPDGELEFDERVTFTKEDLKPILRTALERWLECRLS